MNGLQGYHVLGRPELGLFGPYEPSELNLAAIAAGHVERDVELEATEVDVRVERFGRRFRADRLRAIRLAAATLDPAKMRAAAAAVEGLDDAVADAVAHEKKRLELAMPALVKPGAIERFRWSRRGQIRVELKGQSG